MIVIVKACICSPSLTRQLHYHSQLDKSAARFWKSNEDTFAVVTVSESLVGRESCDRRLVSVKTASVWKFNKSASQLVGRLSGRGCGGSSELVPFSFFLLGGGRESTVTGQPGGALTCPLAATHTTDCMTCQRTFPPLSFPFPVARIL